MENKLVIFDLDGTLLFTLEDLCDSVNYAMEKLSYPKRSLDEVRNFVGHGVSNLILKAIPQNATEKEHKICLDIFREHYKNNMENKTRPYDGIKELLEEIKKNGVHTAVLSNKFDAATKALCEKYFGNLIEFALGECPDIPKKPSPESAEFIMKKFNTEKENTYIVGDSDTDMICAVNCGAVGIGVLWGYRSEKVLIESGAQFIAEKAEDILKIIAQ